MSQLLYTRIQGTPPLLTFQLVVRGCRGTFYCFISSCFIMLFFVDSYHTGSGLDMVPQFSLWPQMRCKVSPCPGLLHFELGKTRLAVEMRERSRQRATPKACVLSPCQSKQIWVPRVYRRKARNLFPSCSRSMRDWNVGNYDEISLVLGKQNITATQTLQSKRCSIFHHFQVPADIIGTLEGIHLPSSHSSGC